MIKILKYDETDKEKIFSRAVASANVEGIVADVINEVKEKGDDALKAYTLKFDGVKLESLEVSEEEIDEAVENADAEFIRILETAAKNIAFYHEKQKRDGFTLNKENGVVLGQKVIPLNKVGIYVPGGTAAYPSTVLMNAVPAKIAGVGK